MSLLGKATSISNHGTAHGIIPRFFLHFEEMSTIAFIGDKSRKELYWEYFDNNQNDFTNFYDSYHNILKLRKEYIDGIITGVYYNRFDNGEVSADKSPEVKIKKAIQDFFKDGKPLLSNFAKSRLLDDEVFILSKVLVANPNAYKKAKEEMLPNLKIKGYHVLFQIIEDAQEYFKRDFFKIRDDFEHNMLKIPDFEVKYIDGVAHIVDPQLSGKNIFKLIDQYYYNALNLIEDLAAYFFGLNACHRSNGLITLFANKGKVDSANFRYRYKITMDVNDPDLVKLITS